MDMEHREEAKREFFAAANSGNGFVSFYSRIFGETAIERRYLIKGGPGTGKSTFMKVLAQRAEENGLCVEYFKCSSDPASLDAVIIAGRVAVIDATSPHCVEGELVGARDDIINLGDFWNSEGLGERLEEIRELTEQKKKCYAKAYRFLSAAMQVDEARRELVLEYADKDKMRKAVTRLARKLRNGEGFDIKPRLCDSIGMGGRARLNSYENIADTVYVINDSCSLGSIFVAMLADEARRKENSVLISYSPINPKYPDAILFEENKVAFVLGESRADNGDTYINMKRFVKKGFPKAEYKIYSRLFEGLVCSAEDALREAGGKHFELEKIYKIHMDFASQGEFLNSFSDRLVKMLKKGL